MINQKGFIPIIIVLIAVALLAGGIFVWQYFGVLREEVLREEIRAPEEEILEEKIPSQIEYNKERLPRFEDFPILERFKGAPAQVDLLSHPRAMEFRTRLREGAKKGPNFAGHYTIVSWGCGTMCQVVAVVDAKTGNVYFAPFTTEFGSEFRIDSNLFIVNPNVIEKAFGGSEIPGWVYSAYYKWENNQFMLLWSTDEKTR